MLHQSLTERVQDAPTMMQRVGGFFALYLIPPVAAAVAIGVLGTVAIGTINTCAANYCRREIKQQSGPVDPASIYVPYTAKSCADIFELDIYFHVFDNVYTRAFDFPTNLP